LPKRNSTVIRGHSLMPIWPEACLGEAQNGSFKKISVLETSASEYYLWLRSCSRDLDNHFCQGVVEFCRNRTGGFLAPQINEDLPDDWRPVDYLG
jgi:hypothetical protein